MPVYEVVAQGGPLQELAEIEKRLGDTTALMERIADAVVLPALRRNYDASGLKSHNGVLKRAITERGARGNQILATHMRLMVAVDYGQIPYAKWAIEGRGPVRARRAKALHFFIGDREVFAKRVSASPPHPVYYLTEADVEKVRRMVADYARAKGIG